MDQVIQVLAGKHREGVKNGNKWAMDVVKVNVFPVVNGKPDLASEEVEVGELVMPKDQAKPAAGLYRAEFSVTSYEGKVGGRIARLIPFKA